MCLLLLSATKLPFEPTISLSQNLHILVLFLAALTIETTELNSLP